MSSFSIIIIDDEADARRIILKYLERYFESINIIGEADSVSEGYQLITKHKPDLIFLDVQMNDGTGFDLLDQLGPNAPKVIFTTAFDEFAVKAFKYKALDYLLKPISSEDFIDTLEYIINNNSKKSIDINKESKKITIPVNNGYQIIDLNTIIYFKAEGSYCVITHVNDEKLIVSKPLKYFVDKICSDKCSFVRTHKSYLVNFNFIDKINRESNASIIMSNQEIIPISRNKKEETLEFADMFY
jgi:two-component system LytT family response regulator